MLRLANTMDIDILNYITNRFFSRYKPELLPDYEFLKDHPAELRRISRKRRRCTLNGHMWEFVGNPKPHDYTIICQRCFPHIDSRQTITTYNPFATKPKAD